MSYDHYDRFGYTRYDRKDMRLTIIVGIALGVLIGALVGLAM